MKILFCSRSKLDPKLGAAQVLLVLADEMRRIGWTCDLIDPPKLAATRADYPEKLAAYLRTHGAGYDVIDFDYKWLPFRADDFPRNPVYVARCQLLEHHLAEIQIPTGDRWRAKLRARFIEPKLRQQRIAEMAAQNQTFQEADLVSVLNREDVAVLERVGVAPEKIKCLPNALPDTYRAKFEAIPAAVPEDVIVGFIGVFTARKGANDFPAIVEAVVREVPAVRFRLMGTRGALPDAKSVLARFPKKCRPFVEVIPVYSPGELPELLSACAVGVFPSYAEGFPLGVMEMLSAALPVFAYDAPGPPEMLPDAYLVPPGDTAGLAQKIASLLQNEAQLQDARLWARERARTFRWADIAAETDQWYRAACAEKARKG